MAEEETRMNAPRLFCTAGRLDSDVPHQQVYFFFTKQMKEWSFILHAKGQNGGVQLISTNEFLYYIDVQFDVSPISCLERNAYLFM